MTSRKLQAEIDRTLKRVQEGMAEFEEIWQKVHSASKANLKDKYEADLKKEIKKLQRYRDQIKTWAASSEVKNKQPLVDARKAIEKDMERFKVCEKETKTKAYSKEGLNLQTQKEMMPEADPERDETLEWIESVRDRLRDQLGTAEEEFNTFNLKSKRGRKSSVDKDRYSQLQEKIDHYNWHIQQLGLTAEKLEEGYITLEQINLVRDDIEYYVEMNPEEVIEDSYFYAMLEEEVTDDVKEHDSEDDAISPVDDDNSVDGNISDASQDRSEFTSPKKEVSKAKEVKSPTESSSVKSAKDPKSMPTSQSAQPSIVQSKRIQDPKSQPVKSSGGINASSSSTVPSKSAKSMASLVSGSSIDSNKSESKAPSAASIVAGGPSVSRPLEGGFASVVKRNQVLTNNVQTQTSKVLDYSKIGKTALSDSNPPLNAAQRLQAAQASASLTPSKPSSFVSKSVSGTPFKQGVNPSTVRSSTPSRTINASTKLANVPKPGSSYDESFEQPIERKIQNSKARSTDSLDSVSKPEQPSSKDSRSLKLQYPSVQRPRIIVPRALDERLAQEHKSGLAMLEMSMHGVSDQLEGERGRSYAPRNPYRTPDFFPTVPASILDDNRVFDKFDADTLFFIFYFQQGTYQQYLAAKQLKKQSWRYHTKYLTWFQRHDDPKVTNDEFEKGTYVYFDYDYSWCQRIKADFTFEYNFLEDELQV